MAIIHLRNTSPALLVLIFFLLRVCATTLLAKSEIRRCTQSGTLRTSEDGTGNACKDNIVVTLTVPANRDTATGILTATVNSVSDPLSGVSKVLKEGKDYF